jgi:hypothetical protein
MLALGLQAKSIKQQHRDIYKMKWKHGATDTVWLCDVICRFCDAFCMKLRETHSNVDTKPGSHQTNDGVSPEFLMQ